MHARHVPSAPTAADLHADLLTRIIQGGSVALTGPQGAGKTHTLRSLAASLTERGIDARVRHGRSLAEGIPLGIFADLSAGDGSPAAIVDHFVRRRSGVVLLIDDADLLDPSSLAVLAHLTGTARIPAVLTTRSVTDLPTPLVGLYDSGDLVEVRIPPLDDATIITLAEAEAGGRLTPAAAATITTTSAGNPLVAREIVRGSATFGALLETPHGWELVDSPVLTPRLAQVIAAPFEGASTALVDAATMVAIAGALPVDALTPDIAEDLLRIPAFELDGDWVRSGHPLTEQALRARSTAATWKRLVGRVVEVLHRAASDVPTAGHRATVLALDHGLAVSASAGLALAEHARHIGDHRLALRAARAALQDDPDSVPGLLVAASTASAEGLVAEADTHLTHAAQVIGADGSEGPDCGSDRAVLALTLAQHRGVGHRDPAGAVEALGAALGRVSAPHEVALLHAALVRWRTVLGMVPTAGAAVHLPDPAEAPSTHPYDAFLLVTGAMAGVVNGPVRSTVELLPALRTLGPADLATVPGGPTLVGLAESMALSYGGDAIATARHLDAAIDRARQEVPESLGTWEYARGFLELLSAGADRALEFLTSAVDHLDWRDTAGILPAALAARGAALVAVGRESEARAVFDALPTGASADPKVLMMSGWLRAWSENRSGGRTTAVRTLLDTARTLQEAHHPFLAGMTAHCAVRTQSAVRVRSAAGDGVGESAEALDLLLSAAEAGGGGLLDLFVRHARAVGDTDVRALRSVAEEAEERGLISTAADTWRALGGPSTAPGIGNDRRRTAGVRADRLAHDHAGLPLWTSTTEKTDTTALTESELAVAELAAARWSTKEISEHRGVSVNTVTNQLSSVYRKLGVRGRVELREALAE
ncbi:helix-turn-helix transcriptional regulator [Brevibacterium litoralis]|uniref:helix-turn-helix transcriptional regulator n=1 Tax=Brevibacterium litoralis TaxID=3138935 RepID=UPI0032EE8119